MYRPKDFFYICIKHNQKGNPIMRILRPLLFFLLLVCLAFPNLYSQAALGIFAQDVVAVPSTVNMGDTVKYDFAVENKGSSPYTGQIQIWVLYDSGNGQANIFDLQVTNLQPNATFPFLVADHVTNAKYDIGDNIILVWPRSDNPNVPTVDTSSVEVTVADTGANGMDDKLMKRIKIFPNTAKEQINLRLEGLVRDFEYVRLTNLQGQELFFSRIPVQAVDLSSYPKGVFFLEVRFKDGLKGTVRILHE
jgi:hypothetical protein